MAGDRRGGLRLQTQRGLLRGLRLCGLGGAATSFAADPPGDPVARSVEKQGVHHL